MREFLLRTGKTPDEPDLARIAADIDGVGGVAGQRLESPRNSKPAAQGFLPGNGGESRRNIAALSHSSPLRVRRTAPLRPERAGRTAADTHRLRGIAYTPAVNTQGDGEIALSRFMRALQKAGLVEMDESAQRAEAEAVAVEAPVESAPQVVMDHRPEPVAVEPALPVAPAPEGPIAEQRPFEDIYAEQSVQASVFPAEKLLRILDGLAALDPAARNAAVRALDAADDAWTVDDALLDAERKTRALAAARSQLEQQARAGLEQARAAVAERDQRQQDAVGRIRSQIADLEGLLEREVTRATEEKSALENAARATKEACLREVARLDAETGRLKRLAATFGGASAVPPP